MAQRPIPKNVNRRPTKRRKLPGPSLLPVILFFGGITLVVLLVLGGGGYFVWKFFANRPPATETPIATTPAPSEQTADAIPTLTPSLPITPTESTTSTPSQGEPPSSFILQDDTLNQVMLEVINLDRQNNGLAPVEWDEQAAHVAQLHANDMATHGFFNHKNMDGYGPQHRYSQIGGNESIQENLHLSTLLMNGQPAPPGDFAELVRKGQESLMNSEGHRKNILTPAHTHVGAGFSYNPATGTFYLVQEFINRYIALEPMPDKAQLDTNILINGRVLSPDITRVPIINLTYESFPTPLSITQLNETSGTYIPAGKFFEAVVVDGLGPDGSFQTNVTLNDEGQKGLYSIRLFIRSEGEEFMANEWFVWVE